MSTRAFLWHTLEDQPNSHSLISLSSISTTLIGRRKSLSSCSINQLSQVKKAKEFKCQTQVSNLVLLLLFILSRFRMRKLSNNKVFIGVNLSPRKKLVRCWCNSRLLIWKLLNSFKSRTQWQSSCYFDR